MVFIIGIQLYKFALNTIFCYLKSFLNVEMDSTYWKTRHRDLTIFSHISNKYPDKILLEKSHFFKTL